jgi:hypothetical protein
VGAVPDPLVLGLGVGVQVVADELLGPVDDVDEVGAGPDASAELAVTEVEPGVEHCDGDVWTAARKVAVRLGQKDGVPRGLTGGAPEGRGKRRQRGHSHPTDARVLHQRMGRDLLRQARRKVAFLLHHHPVDAVQAGCDLVRRPAPSAARELGSHEHGNAEAVEYGVQSRMKAPLGRLRPGNDVRPVRGIPHWLA